MLNRICDFIAAILGCAGYQRFQRVHLEETFKMFSEFKYRLDEDYIFGGSKMGEDPCIVYPNIEPEKWKKFVKYRKSKEFQVYLLYMYSS